MYEEFYKLNTNPFRLTPNPAFYYASKGHARVMAYLEYGIEQGDGFIVVTGDVGTGKTTIIETLINKLKENRDIIVSQIASTQVDEGDLLQMIASSLGLKCDSVSKASLLNLLKNYLLEKHTENKRVLLIVDEVQNMPMRSLEELRMLSNYQEDGKPLIQSFLVGQQQFKSTMNKKDMEQLKQRVIASYHLDALDAEETKHYIDYRLDRAGYQNDPVFEQESFDEIYEFTDGVPRRINVFCERLMLYSAMSELHAVNAETVAQVIGEFNEESTSSIKSNLAVKLKRKSPVSTEKSESNNKEYDDRLRHLERRIYKLENLIESLLDDVEL